MSMKLNITALSAMAGLAPEEDEYSDLSNLAGLFLQNDSLARAISAEIRRQEKTKTAKKTKKTKTAKKTKKTKTAILRDLKARMEFASATNNYIALVYAMFPLNNYSRRAREIIDEAEKAYQTWRAKQTATDKGEPKAKKTVKKSNV